MEIYEAVAFALRYWFVFVIIAILICVIIVSVTEYRDKKRIMQYAGTYIGYMEVIYSKGSGAEIGDRFTLAADNDIGSGSHCNIVINEEGVMKKHVRIFVQGKDVVLRALDSNNTQLNGHPVKDGQLIHTGDIILVGDTALMVHLKEVKNA